MAGRGEYQKEKNTRFESSTASDWTGDDETAKAKIKSNCRLFPRNTRKMTRSNIVEMTYAFDITNQMMDNRLKR